jgi:subtilase family serine protease
VGETDINPADFVNFRKLFDLPLGNTNALTGTQYLNIIYNGTNPGIVPRDEGEADIDTQWSGAVAKGATIDYVVSKSTETTQGTDLSAIYIVDNNLAPVMSYSYGECELFLGTAGNAFYNTLWQQAAAQGITVMVSSGDSGSAGCDDSGVLGAGKGIAVNGLGSTPYNVSVGGTDFYMPFGGTAYWSTSNNSATQASAIGYIPEVPWNESCTNSVFSILSIFSGRTPEQVCNSATASADGFLAVVGGGGGPSACTVSDGASRSSCSAGYPKPSWQSGTGVPADGVRDTPDISLFASSGFFGGFYIVCQQSGNSDGEPCNLTSSNFDFAGYGGTSVASPAFAGILSLVNQKVGSRLGNVNYVLYDLANQQGRADTACNAVTGSSKSGCIFHDVTTDTNSMPCINGSSDCNIANSSDRYGLLAGYNSNAGYDLSTGLGSVDAANLVNNWVNATFTSSTTTLALSPTTISHGSAVTAIANVGATTGTPTGNVSINAFAGNGAVSSGALTNGVFTASLGSFPGGSYSVQARYAGDGTYAASDSNTVLLTVNSEASVTTIQPLVYTPSSSVSTPIANSATYPYGGLFILRTNVAGMSGEGTATGNVTLTDSGVSLDGGIFRLNSTGNAEDLSRALSPGTHILAASYAGDASFSQSQSFPFTLTIVKAQTAATLQASQTSLSVAQTLTLSVKVNALGFSGDGQSGFGAIAPTGTINFNASNGAVLGTAVLAQDAFPAYATDAGEVAFTFPASVLAVGTNIITASYSGDANYQPSSVPPISLAVTASSLAASTTTLTLSSAVVTSGTSFSFSAVVSPGGPTPTGTIFFASDGQPLGTPIPLASGAATIFNSSANILPGTHRITATYSGDTNYQASVSAPMSFTIVSANASGGLSIVVSPPSVVQGSEIVITATITPDLPAPTGSVQILLDGSPYGQPIPVAGASLSIPLLTGTFEPGDHIFQLSYSGDLAHLANISPSATLTIQAPSGSFTLTSSTTSAIAAHGQTSSAVVLSVIPSAEFHSTVSFACIAGLPSGASCSFTPAFLTPSDANPQTTTLTFSSTATLGHIVQPRRRNPTYGFAVSLASLLLFCYPSRKRRRSIFALLLTLSALGTLNGCGKNITESISAGAPGSGDSSSATYAITVRASGGSTVQTTTIQLTIQ